MKMENMQIILKDNNFHDVFSFEYKVFEKFKTLILESLENGTGLQVKLDECGCPELDCAVCTNKWEPDTWYDYKPIGMYYDEKNPVIKIIDMRHAITDVQRDEAVEIVQSLGYTLKDSSTRWKPPLGINKSRVRENVMTYLKQKFNAAGGNQHINWVAAVTDNVINMVNTGLNEKQMHEVARQKAGEPIE